MDWYSRYVLSWEVSVPIDREFCVSTLESALQRYGSPEIFNTDQGSQFTTTEFTDTQKDAWVQISMDKRELARYFAISSRPSNEVKNLQKRMILNY